MTYIMSYTNNELIIGWTPFQDNIKTINQGLNDEWQNLCNNFQTWFKNIYILVNKTNIIWVQFTRKYYAKLL